MSDALPCQCRHEMPAEEVLGGPPAHCPTCGRPRVMAGPAAPPDLGSGPAIPWGIPVAAAAAVLPGVVSEKGVTEDTPVAVSKIYYRLYRPRAVAGAALLGGLPGGCLLLAANYRALKKPLLAWLVVFLAVLGTVSILVAVGYWAEVPPRFGAVRYLGPLFLVQLAGSAALVGTGAWVLQGRACAAHEQAGERWASFGKTIFPCLLGSGFLFFLQFFITYPVTWDGTGRGLEFGPGEELYYTEGVSREQAVRLGNKLREYGVFNGLNAKTLVLAREGDHFLLRVFLRWDAAWNDPETLDYFQRLRDRLAEEVFAGQDLEILLCDQFNAPKGRVQKRPAAADHEAMAPGD